MFGGEMKRGRLRVAGVIGVVEGVLVRSVARYVVVEVGGMWYYRGCRYWSVRKL